MALNLIAKEFTILITGVGYKVNLKTMFKLR